MTTGSVHEVVVPPAAPNALHRYRVTVHAAAGPVDAVGDSDPVIIIDNP